ncbi:MAG: hypothetical protein JRG69_12805 [Deltaproteobacteria bacterium]|nr:hypothetical protein [Deltaproteobacteria bacterium]
MMGCPQGSEGRNRDNPLGFASAGILGVVPSAVEVIGVFPTLSATVLPHQQEIKFRRGDSFDINIQVQDDRDPPNMVDISRSILRFGAKQGYGTTWDNTLEVGNEGLQILKTSALPAEIEFLNETSGQARIKIRKSDTVRHPLGLMRWDLELTKAVEHIDNQPGTLVVVSGQRIVQGIGTDFIASGVGLGDILHVDNKYIMILEVTSATSMIVDHTDWTTGSGLEYNLYHGQSKTIASGPWNCVGDVVI